MFEIGIEINGRKVAPNSIEDALERAVMDDLIAQVKRKVQRGLSFAESQKLRIQFKGTSLKGMSVELSGPEEIVRKAQRILS